MTGRRSLAIQRGVVLVASLLVLLVLGLIAATVARTSLLQLHMAGNDEARIAAMQRALAAVDSVLAGDVGAWTAAGVGDRLCTPASPEEACDERTLVLGPGVQPDRGTLDVAVVRLSPRAGRMPVMGEARASSTVHYRVARFEVQVAFDGAGAGLGLASLAQGALIRLPAATQSDGGSP